MRGKATGWTDANSENCWSERRNVVSESCCADGVPIFFARDCAWYKLSTRFVRVPGVRAAGGV